MRYAEHKRDVQTDGMRAYSSIGAQRKESVKKACGTPKGGLSEVTQSLRGFGHAFEGVLNVIAPTRTHNKAHRTGFEKRHAYQNYILLGKIW